MNSSRDDVPAILLNQLCHQIRLTRQRMTWRIPAIFAVGLVCILGLFPAVAASLERGTPRTGVFVYGFLAIFFGWAVIYSMIWPFFVRPRIVAYFKRELEPYGGFTMASFFRGRALYREIVVLEELTTRLGAAPLSSFGFSHDLYEQEVRWHAASAGLRTVEALRQGGHSSSAKKSMQGVCTREVRQGSYR